jgi:DNA-directed RNA polymerase subunit L
VKIKPLRQEGKELRLLIEGETHTFCNLLQDVLLSNDDVEFAGYRVPHPLFRQAIVYVRTKSREPQKALVDATTLIKIFASEFKEEWERTLKAHE